MKNTIAKKFLFSMLLSACTYCYELKAQSPYSISIISGPSVRVPGITTPTVLQFNGANSTEVRWTNASGVQIGEGASISVLASGTYNGWVVKVEFVAGEGEVEYWPVTPSATIEIKGLEHHISVSGPNPLDKNNPTTQLCYFSNAFPEFTVTMKWYRGLLEDGNTSVCRYVNIPGVYIITVQYFYGAEASHITAPSSVLIGQDPGAPDIKLPIGSYNPVTPPDITVNNYYLFSSYRVFIDDKFVANSTSSYIETLRPGRYRIEGISGSTSASSEDFFVSRGDIPVPDISATNKGVLFYENPEVKLSVRSGYNSGYTWYKNGAIVDGASTNILILSKGDDLGIYTVRGCATYPDGFSQCKTSSPVEITGEILHVNFVRKKTPLVENITAPAELDSRPYTDVNVSTAYADGFARIIQNVERAASPKGKDVVVEKRYDQFEREHKQILPFTRPASDGSYGYVLKSLKPVNDFYMNEKIANTTVPFGETRFEASPLNRVLEQGAPGEDWQLSSSHTKKLAYLNNKANDNVWIWNPTDLGLSASAFYPDGVLAVVEASDENGHLLRQYSDKSGRTVLAEKTIEGGAKLRTYFVFDDLGRLTNIIPPKTIAALAVAPSAIIANDILAKECYSYVYDERGRVIEKNIPGAGLTYIVYDKWDRIVLTQTANQRIKNRWSFSKYDAHNRPVMTGEVVLTDDHTGATEAVNSFYATISTNPVLRYEETGGAIHGYTNRSFPVLSNDCQVYTVSYYDNYSFLLQFGNDYQFNPEPSLGLTTSSAITQGLRTGMKTVILGTCNYLKTATYFDNKHRVIQVLAENHLGGIDKMSNKLDFTGRVTNTKMVHSGLQVVTISERHTYDPQGRKLQVFEIVNNEPEILRCDYHYNELGQMVEKNIHSTDGGNTFLQSEDISYNIRGWLEEVNATETEQNVTYQDQYGYKLSYTTAPAGLIDFQPSFNGNIAAFSEVRPATIDANNNPFKSVYSHRYDYRDQLTGANYYQSSDPLKNGAFDMPEITYDQNGNIKTLKRKGDGNLIDDLNYQYDGNQLRTVNDTADLLKGFIKKQ